jgi:hypothetical protein
MCDAEEGQWIGWLLGWLGKQPTQPEARIVSFPRRTAPKSMAATLRSLDGGRSGCGAKLRAAAGGEEAQQLQAGYRGNRTSTTKYTLLSFLPKSLFEQYR